MTEWSYWRRFYRNFNWDAAYKNRCAGMAKWLSMEKRVGVKPPPAMIAMNARMLLEAHYRGRWRCVWAIFTDACAAHYRERYWPAWEWIRTRIFRRPQDETLAYVERMDEEDQAISEMAKQI